MSKKALLIGLRYTFAHRRHPDIPLLPGAVKDTEILKNMLIDSFEWEEEDITILTDEDDDEESDWTSVTRRDIISAMEDLVDGAEDGDRRVFFWSGHAFQLDEREQGNEADGQDEVLCPGNVSFEQFEDGRWDFDNPHEHTIIRDDDVKKILVDPLPPGASMIMIFDCCHSGTAADLPYDYQDGDPLPKSKWGKGYRNRSMHHHVHATVGHDDRVGESHRSNPSAADIDLEQMGEVTSWSACMDDQTTIDTRNGGIFLNLFQHQFQRGRTSHRDVLHGVAIDFKTVVTHRNKGHAKHKVVPKPQLGSLRPCTDLMDEDIQL